MTPRPAVAEHFNCSEWIVDRHVEAGHGARTEFHLGDAAITYEEFLDAVSAACEETTLAPQAPSVS